MGIFNQLRVFFKPKSEYDKLLAMVGPMIVKGYRRIGKERGIAPTKKTSDKKIIEIYLEIESAFKNAARQRNEELPQGYINSIVLFFYQVYEKYNCKETDNLTYNLQLEYQIRQYLKEGLGKEFRKDLQLFETELEE
jgi:hypothetical protein